MLRAELTCFGLPYPTPVTSDQEFEDLLLRYLLSPGRPSKIRLVERFLTRGGRALVAGDTSHSPSVAADNVAATAHRFTVLVPEGLSTAETAMVTRVVDLEKPAHTAYEVRYYWDAFRIGESRLAIDTVLGEESRFVPIILGEHHLGDGYLSAAPPMDAGDRFVSDRDRLGMTPL